MVDQALADEKLFDLYFTRAQNVTKLLVDSGYPDIEELSREELKQDYTDESDRPGSYACRRAVHDE